MASGLPAVRDRLSTESVRWVRQSIRLDVTFDRFVALYRELAGRASGL